MGETQKRIKITKKHLRKAVAFLLVIALTVTSINTNFAEKEIKADAKQKTEVSKKAPEVVKEIKKERTKYSNTYLMSDGSKKLEIHSEPIRFKEDGEWVDYDASLKALDEDDREKLQNIIGKEADKYANVNVEGNVKQYFPEELNNQGIVMSKDKYVVSMAPVMEKWQEQLPEETTAVENDKSEQEPISEKYTGETDGDTIVYSSENSSVKYEYISMNDGVKENIILEEKPETNVFRYKVDAENVKLKVRKNDRGISVLDKKTKKVVAYINPPYLIDGKEQYDYESVSYKLVKENGENVIELVVDEEYFEKEDLQYPVKIDPSMVWMGDYISTAGVWSASFMADSTTINDTLIVSNSLMDSYPYVNTENRMYVDTSKLLTNEAFVGAGGSISDTYIESAYMGFSETEKISYYPTGTVQIKRALGEWSPETITWNTQPEISEDYIGEAVCTGIEGEGHILDITEWIQNIADGKMENHGLVFTCPEPGMAAIIYGPKIKYIADENGMTVGSLHMIISVTYREMSKYDGSVNLTAEYNEETGKIETTIEDTNTSKTVTGYKIFERKDNGENFTAEYTGTTIDETAQLDVDNISECVDVRACVLYSDGTAMPTNIVSLQKYEETAEESSEEETTELEDLEISELTEVDITDENLTGETGTTSTVTFEQITCDTDGDGLEDGYEIWDFKTLWNTETGVDTEGNKTYDLDTDDDGFPDSYEVFTLGTDPALANRYGDNGEEIDSDNDGWSDYTEYQEDTDPWFYDSDFDNVQDDDDGTPRKTNNYTRQTVASSAQVRKGLYDREYSTTDKGVVTTYIENIYRGDIKSVYYDYGEPNINKGLKYFYDQYGNNTAIIEEYDDEYYESNGLEDSQTICITYTYDENGNVEFICDQSNKYTIEYGDDYEIDKVSVGTQKLISYDEDKLEDNSENEEDLSEGDIISRTQDTATYENGQIVKTVTTTKKVEEDNDTSVAKEIIYYYDNDTSASYKVEYNSNGKIINLYDYTGSEEIVYKYTYTDNGTKVERKDVFTREITTTEDDENNKSIDQIVYTFKDVKGETTSYSATIVNDTDVDDTANEMSASMVLFNQDKITYDFSKINNSTEISLYSSLYNQNILKTTSTADSNIKTVYEIDTCNEDKRIEYIYDLAGNIINISIDGDIAYEYTYDAHGRLIVEKDYINFTSGEYGYDETSNVQSIKVGTIDSTGKIISRQPTKYAAYNNSQWSDQLSSFNGVTINYDEVGNPKTYINGETFTWSRGRQLSEVKMGDDSKVKFIYNEKGLRAYKDTEDISVEYTWDEDKLIREQVIYKATGKKYDVWYFYDSQDNVAGFEYSFIDDNDSKQKVQIYYEKNLQGDIIGLLDSQGAEIATYSYDAWGNITSTICSEGNEVPYNLNHIKYRGYYRDEETGFYYLQTRYYDPEICRFINSDDVNNLGSSGMVFGYNLYAYCEGNPIRYTDPSGKSFKSLWKKIKKYINKTIHMGNDIARSFGVDTASYGAFLLDMKKDKNGIYHASFDGWQQYFGYNDFYDFMFDIGTSMDKRKFPFTCGRKKYILWAWKGDYINLGAGAELGIYYGGGPHWKVDKKLAMTMIMTVTYKKKTIISYKKNTWWITGFNPKYQNAKATDLRVGYKVYFAPYKMYSAFHGRYNKKDGWTYDGHKKIGSYTF